MKSEQIKLDIENIKRARALQLKRFNAVQAELSMIQTNILKNDGVIAYLNDQLKKSK